MSRAPRQLDLPFAIVPAPPSERNAAADRLRLSLESRVGGAVHLTVTDNRHSIVSVRTRADGVHAVRVHHMFLAADAGTVKSLARYVERRDQRSSRELGRFIAAHRHLLGDRVRRTRGVILRTRGRYHDLRAIFEDLNRRYYAEAVKARITWGPARKGHRRRRSIKMGTYCVEDRLIRIHPVLDQGWVPRFFVEWIVFHEMLHDVVGVQTVDGKRSFHPPEFRELERRFEHYDSAREWERRNIDLLLTAPTR